MDLGKRPGPLLGLETFSGVCLVMSKRWTCRVKGYGLFFFFKAFGAYCQSRLQKVPQFIFVLGWIPAARDENWKGGLLGGG